MAASGQNRTIVLALPILCGWLSPTPVRSFTRSATCNAFASISRQARLRYVAGTTFAASIATGCEAQLASKGNNSKAGLRKARSHTVKAPRNALAYQHNGASTSNPSPHVPASLRFSRQYHAPEAACSALPPGYRPIEICLLSGACQTRTLNRRRRVVALDRLCFNIWTTYAGEPRRRR